MGPPRKSALPALFVSLTLCACTSAPSYVRLRQVAAESTLAQDVRAAGQGAPFSRYTRELLAQLRMTWRPAACREVLEAVANAPLSATVRIFSLAELTLAAAQSRECPMSRDRLLLNAARLSYGQLLIDSDDDQPPPEHLVVGFYNRAVRELLAAGGREDLVARAAGLGIVLEPDSVELASRFDRYVDADSLAFSGFISRHRRFGLGAALIGVTRDPAPRWQHARAIDGGYAQAVTALLHFEADGSITLELLDASFSGFIAGDRFMPLHADLTAPYAWQLGRSHLRSHESTGAFAPADAAAEGGLLLLEPFDPQRIPVLMIHGFWSTPEAWRNITNEILSTPRLRDRFQVWHYFYPTGANYLYSAGVLRAELGAFLEELRGAYGVSAVQPLVVIGHSEGGLLARALVVRSGAALWDTVFRVPPEALAAPGAVRAAFVRTLVYEPLADVDSLVLMATPNSGTRPTRNSLRAALVNAFTDLPDGPARALRTLEREHPEQLRAASRGWFARGGMTALESMAPDNPLMQAFGRLPIDRRVHLHSIIARYPTLDGTLDGDEYVPSASARVPGAESELVVDAPHQDIDGIEVIGEIRRILELRVSREAAQ
jgi:hypothetical protein